MKAKKSSKKKTLKCTDLGYDIEELPYFEIPTHFNFKDLTGKKYGKRTALRYAGRNEKKQHCWYVICDCGKTPIIIISASNLTNPHSFSCGCHKLEVLQNRAKHRLVKSPEYRAYQRAKQRCGDPNDKGYHNYGGRGIEFRFSSFEEFLDDIGFRPSNDHSLDRINNEGHYERGNARWATRFEQCRNRRTDHWITYNGKTQCLEDWAIEIKMDMRTLWDRINRHDWCISCSLTLPTGQKKNNRCTHR